MPRNAANKKFGKQTSNDKVTGNYKNLFNDDLDFSIIDKDARANLNSDRTYNLSAIPNRNPFATIVLDNEVVTRVATRWVQTILASGSQRYDVNESIQCLAHALCEVHFALQIVVSSCPSYISRLNALVQLTRSEYKLPKTIMTLLNCFGDFETKAGEVRIEYVEATIYTAFMRAKALFEQSELIENRKIKGNYSYLNTVLNQNLELPIMDNRGFTQLQKLVINKLKELSGESIKCEHGVYSIPHFNENFSLKELTAYIPNDYPDRDSVISLYTVALMKPSVKLNDDERTLVNTVSAYLGIKTKFIKSETAIEECITIFNDITCKITSKYERWFDFNYHMVEATYSPHGTACQLHVKSKNEKHCTEVGLITNDSDRILGYMLYPAKKVEYNLSFDVSGAINPSRCISNLLDMCNTCDEYKKNSLYCL